MRDKNEITLVIAAPRHRSIVNDRAFLKSKGEERDGREGPMIRYPEEKRIKTANVSIVD